MRLVGTGAPRRVKRDGAGFSARATKWRDMAGLAIARQGERRVFAPAGNGLEIVHQNGFAARRARVQRILGDIAKRAVQPVARPRRRFAPRKRFIGHGRHQGAAHNVGKHRFDAPGDPFQHFAHGAAGARGGEHLAPERQQGVPGVDHSRGLDEALIVEHGS